MEAKIQIRIGLITAAVSIVSTTIFVGESVMHHFMTESIPPTTPHFAYPFFILGVVFPSVYVIALILKKLKHTMMIFWLWCIGWITSLVLFCFFAEIMNELSTHCWGGVWSLWSILWMPSDTFLYPLVDISYELSISLLLRGVISMLLLWIGVRGLKQMVGEESQQNQ